MAMINVGTGLSEKEDLIGATREATKQAKDKIKIATPKLLMVFHTFNYPLDQGEKVMAVVQEFFSKEAPIIGGSFLGIFVEKECRDAMNSVGKQRGVGVLALDSEYLNVGLGLGIDAEKDPVKAGSDSITMALENLEYNPSVAYTAMMKKGIQDIVNIRPISGIIITPGLIPMFVDMQIANGISKVARKAIRITGGGVSGGIPPVTKEVIPGVMYYNGKVYTKAVISCVFGSDLEVGYGVGTGFKPTGAGFFVTKAEGPTIHEFDRQPAWPFLSQEMKKRGVELDPKAIYFSLAQNGYFLALPEASGDFYWPQSLMSTSDNKTISTPYIIRTGTALALVSASKEDCLKAVEEAAVMVIEDAGSKDLGFIFHASCALRGSILGAEEYFKEAERIKKITGEKIPIFGMCSEGELSFYKTGALIGTAFTFCMCGIANKLVSEL